MTLLQKIKDADSKFSRSLSSLTNYALKKEFKDFIEELCKKPIVIDLSKEKDEIERKLEVKNIPNNPGIYLFEANFAKWNHSWKNFESEFQKFCCKQNRKVNHFPGLKKQRVAKTLEKFKNKKNQWIPFYLGNSLKLNSRIKNHVILRGGSGTFALKLYARKANLKGIKFRTSYYEVKDLKEPSIALKKVESEIRNILNPITGRQ